MQGVAGVCKTRILKPFSLLRLAKCCGVLRSRWCQSGVKSGRCVRLRLQHLTEEQSSVEDQPTITLLVFCLCRDFADGEPFVLQGPAYRLSPGADTHLRIEVGQVPLDRTL